MCNTCGGFHSRRLNERGTALLPRVLGTALLPRVFCTALLSQPLVKTLEDFPVFVSAEKSYPARGARVLERMTRAVRIVLILITGRMGGQWRPLHHSPSCQASGFPD